MSRAAQRDEVRGQELPLRTAWSGASIARWLTVGWGLLTLLGILALKLPGATVVGNELSFERCVFTAVNAATLTGFQQSVALDQFGWLGQAMVLLLMVAATNFALIIGGLALTRALRLRYTANDIVQTTLLVYIFSVGIGTSILLDSNRGLLPSAAQAAAAVGNCGIFLGTLPGATEGRTHLALLPLMVIGGLSIPIILELKELIFQRRPLSKHSSVIVALLATVYLAGVIALTPWEDVFGEGGSFVRSVTTGSTLSIASRTSGLPIVSPGVLSRVGQWLLIGSMLIGAAPGSAAGGLHVTSLFHAWRGTRRALREESGRRLTGIAAVWIFVFLMLVIVTLLALIGAVPEMAADRLFMLAASAVSNVGLAHEPVAVTGAGLTVLSAAMLLGRAAGLGVLWWVACDSGDIDVAV